MEVSEAGKSAGLIADSSNNRNVCVLGPRFILTIIVCSTCTPHRHRLKKCLHGLKPSDVLPFVAHQSVRRAKRTTDIETNNSKIEI